MNGPGSRQASIYKPSARQNFDKQGIEKNKHKNKTIKRVIMVYWLTSVLMIMVAILVVVDKVHIITWNSLFSGIII
jgi:hypothetical protein